jgi:hypothetical protein
MKGCEIGADIENVVDMYILIAQTNHSLFFKDIFVMDFRLRNGLFFNVLQTPHIAVWKRPGHSGMPGKR